ncbi:MAG: hypothetical protein WC967_14430 [Balneolaceae bacterium]
MASRFDYQNINSPEIYLGVNRLNIGIGGEARFIKDAYKSTEIPARFILRTTFGINFSTMIKDEGYRLPMPQAGSAGA